MKTLIYLQALSVLIFLSSCDKIKTPIQSTQVQGDTTKYIRKVLIEDYTGHTCGNCPPAAVEAENLSKAYPGKVVVIAVHAGFFAKVKANYPASYTTTAGNDWDGSTGFNISGGAGNPNGMINRKSYDGNQIQKETKWSSSVQQAVNEPYILGLTVTPVYDPTTRNLSATVKSTFKTAYQNDVMLSVVFTEDSIVGAQTDYTKSPSDLIPDYLFMHMLRGDLNGSWGQLLKAAPVTAGSSASITTNQKPLNTLFVDKQVSIVAFAYDAQTKEVLQVEKVKIR